MDDADDADLDCSQFWRSNPGDDDFDQELAAAGLEAYVPTDGSDLLLEDVKHCIGEKSLADDGGGDCKLELFDQWAVLLEPNTLRWQIIILRFHCHMRSSPK